MKLLRSRQKQIFALLALLLLVILGFVSIHGFIVKVRQNETAIADQTLLTAADNGVILIQTVFTDYIMNVENIATLYEQQENLTSKTALTLLDSIAGKNGYDRLAVDFPDGTTYTSDGYVFDMSHFGYLDKIKNGESFITDVLVSLADETQTISFLAPLHDKDGTPIASLRLTVNTTTMTNAINLTLFGGEGYYHLVDENGYYVAAGQSANALLMEQNFFDAIAVMDYDNGYSVEDIQKTFTEGITGFVRYSVDSSKRYAYCQPVGINNWVLMTIVPQKIIAQAELQNISFATTMTVQLSAILIFIFVYLYLTQSKASKIAVLNDKCFRALAEQTSKVIFEWDFDSDKIIAMNNFKALFGREMVTQNSAEEALNAHMVHPDDQGEFRRVFDMVLGGRNIDNIRFRVKLANGDYHWCQLSGIVIFDHTGHPYKAIGSLEDIHAVMMNEAQMKLKSETDQLTGLYNKTSTEQRIKQFLADGAGGSALMIIDIDNFKSVNDSFGHQFGDYVLVDFAEVLKPFSGGSNVVGRIGGDEFFLFLGDYCDEEFVYQTAERIGRLFEKTYTEKNTVCHSSASIGISFFPRDGMDFEALYKRADVALYRTKATGKNGYTVYNSNLGSEVSSRTAIDQL